MPEALSIFFSSEVSFVTTGPFDAKADLLTLIYTSIYSVSLSLYELQLSSVWLQARED